ncbi:MAG: AsmA-like C-terminal region-containing protein [Opitutales bacterium]|nr:AsmA-like C-terminal region-containing protein [Opitutales bacterium]
MQSESKSKRNYAWHSACLLCKAALDFVYTLGVVVLTLLVGIFAYIITLDEMDMPRFLIQYLEKELESQGASISMSGIRIQPSGRIIIDQPIIESTDLQSEIARADRIIVKMNPTLMIFGRIQLNELYVDNGSIIAPAMLSRTGLPEPLVDKIDLATVNTRSGWVIQRSTSQFSDARLTMNGTVSLATLELDEPEEEPLPLTERLIAFHKKAREYEDYLNRVSGLEANIAIRSVRNDPRSIRASLSAESAHWDDRFSATGISLMVNATEKAPLRIDAQLESVSGPENIHVKAARVTALWNDFPRPDQWLPDSIHCTINSLGQESEYITNISTNVEPHSLTQWNAKGQVQIADSSWNFAGNADVESKTGNVLLSGSPTNGLIEFLSGIAIKFSPQLASMPLNEFARFDGQVDVNVLAEFEGSWKPKSAKASLVANQITSLGARFDQTIAEATIRGNFIQVPNIWLRSGPQNGRLSVDFDLDSKRRRVLIDGLFNPNTVNGWIPANWWTELWENFQFSEEGFYCLMDSEQIVKRPETLRLTGYALGKKLGLRGHAIEEVESRMYIRQRYFDIYDMSLKLADGSLQGESQFSIAVDPRDQKNKLSAIWIDAESTTDLNIGPDVLYELRSDVEDILEPYNYIVAPKIQATASSIREKGLFQYDIDLAIKTDEPISYHNFPLDSLEADILISNDRVSIPNIQADLANGIVDASAELRGKEIDLKVTLSEAHFGNTLEASAIYFAANDEESAANEFSPKELANYGGIANLEFNGSGIVGNSLSFDGKGTYQISGADFYQLQLFGDLSRIFDSAGLPITTLRFEDADGAFDVEKRYVRFPEVRLKGRVAQIRSEGNYDLAEGQLDFTAQLQPFRSVPIFELPARVLDIFTGIFEVQLTGTIAEPKWNLFRGGQREEASESGASENASE